jgi:ferrochelatase
MGGIKWSVLDRWGTDSFLVETVAARIRDQLTKFPADMKGPVIILFSAHSLPMKV